MNEEELPDQEHRGIKPLPIEDPDAAYDRKREDQWDDDLEMPK